MTEQEKIAEAVKQVFLSDEFINEFVRKALCVEVPRPWFSKLGPEDTLEAIRIKPDIMGHEQS